MAGETASTVSGVISPAAGNRGRESEEASAAKINRQRHGFDH